MNRIWLYVSGIVWWQWLAIWAVMLAIFSATGIAWGYSAGIQEQEKNLEFTRTIELQVQYTYGLADLEAGRFDLARQRFEYIIQQKPDFPGVTEQLAKTILISSKTSDGMSADATPTADPSPTPDTRGIDELYAVASSQFQNQDWRNLLHTLIALRDIDPHYQAIEVDRMVFLTLRYLGEKKILEDGDLEAGLYDLALSEKFVMLDSQAQTYRDWAYLYQFGVSFWGIFPDKVVQYFSQLVTAAPFLRDLSGIFAKDRYTMALLNYGDHLAELGDWCGASAQYNLAKDLTDNQSIQPTAVYAEGQCNPQLATPMDIQVTVTPVMTLTLEVTPTPEITAPLESSTLTLETTDSTPETVTPQPSPIVEETLIPVDTPETESP